MRRFFQGSAGEDKDSQESAEVATLEPPESTEPTEERSVPEEAAEEKRSQEPVVSHEVATVSVRDESSANRMRAAFAGVAQAVDGEVESLRRSLAALEKSLDRAVDGERQARTGAVDGVKRELSSRIDEVVSGREKIVLELKQSAEQERKRVAGSVEDVKQAAVRERERIAGRVDEMKDAIEKSVNERVEKLSGKLDALGRNLGALQLELQRQMETSERVTALLNSMAGVFTVNQAQASPASAAAAGQPAATASDRGVESSGPREVDDALERVFR